LQHSFCSWKTHIRSPKNSAARRLTSNAPSRELGYLPNEMRRKRTEDDKHAALVLISAPGRTIDVLLREQIAHQLQQQPTIPAAFVLSKYNEIIASLKQTGTPSAAAFADLQANSEVPPQLTMKTRPCSTLR
jgi:hypothetical protein